MPASTGPISPAGGRAECGKGAGYKLGGGGEPGGRIGGGGIGRVRIGQRRWW